MHPTARSIPVIQAMINVFNTTKTLITRKKPQHWGRTVVLGIPMTWFFLFFLLPFFVVLRYSFGEMADAGVGVASLWRWNEDAHLTLVLNFSTYTHIFAGWWDSPYVQSYGRSLLYAGITALVTLIIGYPFAYAMARAKPSNQALLLMLVMLPFWTSFFLRMYAWKIILNDDGIINNALLFLGFVDQPVKMLYTPFSLILGMVYGYLPFMVLPLYSTLSKLDVRYLEAAADLGARPWTSFWRITVPLSKPGIIAGTMLVFIPCIGEYVIPDLLGGPETLMIGRMLYDEMFGANDWTSASAMAVVIILLVIVPIALFNRAQSQATNA